MKEGMKSILSGGLIFLVDSLVPFIKQAFVLFQNMISEESLTGVWGHLRPKYLENTVLE